MRGRATEAARAAEYRSEQNANVSNERVSGRMAPQWQRNVAYAASIKQTIKACALIVIAPIKAVYEAIMGDVDEGGEGGRFLKAFKCICVCEDVGIIISCVCREKAIDYKA